MTIFYSLKKRYVLLLEILIALAIVAMCILPLLAPHATILTQQQKFLKKTTLDHTVNLLYVDVLEQMQRNIIPWQAIDKHTQIPVDDDMMKRIGITVPFPFKGYYRFDIKPHEKSGEPSVKGNPKSGWYVYKLVVTFVFTPTHEGTKKEKYIFPYRLSVLRHSANGPNSENQGNTGAAGAPEGKKEPEKGKK